MTSEIFVENKRAPQQTKIYLSRLYYYWKILTAIFWIAIGSYFLFTRYWIFGILFVLYILFAYRRIPKHLKLLKDNNIQIELSNKGISLYGGKTISWNSISQERIMIEPQYTSQWNPPEYLTFKAKSQDFKILVNPLDTSSTRLEYLLKIYRKRSEKVKN